MRTSFGEKAFRLFNIVFMIFLCVITLYPYLNQLAVSLNDGQDTIFGGITVFPREFTWSNYETVFSNSSFVGSLIISGGRVLLGTLLGLILITGAAYALTRKNLPGRNFLIIFLIIPTFISGGLIPLYFLYRYLHLMNNFLIYVLPMGFVFFYMIIIRTYIQSLPSGLEEAAIIDGANEIQILRKIIIPLSMPVMATVILWLAVTHWNDWTTSLYFVTKKDLYTLQFVMYKVIKEAELVNELAVTQARMGGGSNQAVTVTPESIKAATIIVATFPIVALYPFLQKYFIQGVMIGAIKE
ncbi:sugar ABC transporter permease [Paenibacillus baekrokdamisoli]|uniref:Sugar ABC transporter permease n=1 Tax=Paenibacillus baekrokdamisoli TaxID=1712516 RepID=A0A3G9JJI7_9BACL|nr:carbohydrate ABC transporter permease [Paenibacillus baekrokdamisoli]MBB3071760.1 putative aldouronate transport system permease protein [Paenibacillus baekrokdamisoli]BBH24258.1 sugar ABC transporter permease [Paenibacillus baekrokdamisoli]